MLGTKNDEILACLLLIFVGYTIAKMFSKRCEGFSVGIETPCNDRITDHSEDLVDEINECIFGKSGDTTQCNFEKNFFSKNRCLASTIGTKSKTCSDLSTVVGENLWLDLDAIDQNTLCKNYTNIVTNGNRCVFDYEDNAKYLPTCSDACPLVKDSTAADPKCPKQIK